MTAHHLHHGMLLILSYTAVHLHAVSEFLISSSPPVVRNTETSFIPWLSQDSEFL